MTNTFFGRNGYRVLLVFVFLMPLTCGGAFRALRSNKNEVKDWLPKEFEETSTYREFQRHFEGEEFILISWKGCTLSDPRLPHFADLVRTDETGMFKGAFTGPEIKADLEEQLNKNRVEGARRLALERLKGYVIGHDLNQTCAVITLTSLGRDKKRPAVNRVRALAAELELSRDDIHMGGPPVDNVAIDEEGEKTLYRLAGLSLLVGWVISFLCLRSFGLMATVFVSAFYAGGVSLATVWYTGGTVNAILLTMPSLIYVLGLSGAIHIVNYYRDAVRVHGLEGAPGRGVKDGWGPCTLAAATTAIGLASLYISQITPIRSFGVFSALGVLATLALLFLFLPAILEMWPPKAVRRESKTLAGKSEDETPAWWHRYAEIVVRRNGLVTICGLALMAFLGFGLQYSTTSVKLMKLFAPEAEIIHDYTWLENQLGDLVPMEVVMRVEEDKTPFDFLGRMQLVERIQDNMEAMPEINVSMSAATHSPPLPKQTAGYTIRNRVFSKRLKLHRDAYVANDWLSYEGLVSPELRREIVKQLRGHAQDATVAKVERKLHPKRRIHDGMIAEFEELLAADGELDPERAARVVAILEEKRGAELWRITARLPALTDLNYGHFIDDLKQAVDVLLRGEVDAALAARVLDVVREDVQQQLRHTVHAQLPPDASPAMVARLDDVLKGHTHVDELRQRRAEFRNAILGGELVAHVKQFVEDPENHIDPQIGQQIVAAVRHELDSGLPAALSATLQGRLGWQLRDRVDTALAAGGIDEAKRQAVAAELANDEELRLAQGDEPAVQAKLDAVLEGQISDEVRKQLNELLAFRTIDDELRNEVRQFLLGQQPAIPADDDTESGDTESGDTDQASLSAAAGTPLVEAKVVDEVDQVLAAAAAPSLPGISCIYTGMVPLVYKAQNELMKSLVTSFLLAFGLIALVMMGVVFSMGNGVLNSLVAGLVTMIPNLFPAIAIFGIMAWLGVEIDIGSMMTASVAMGVAVDDTVHYLFWFRRGIQSGLSRKDSVLLAYRRCATAMLQTTAIGGFGLVVMAFSSFTPTERFGYLMFTLLWAALIGDLLLLPAILAGPAGRFFSVRKKVDDGSDHGDRHPGVESGDDEQVEPSVESGAVGVSLPGSHLGTVRSDRAHRRKV